MITTSGLAGEARGEGGSNGSWKRSNSPSAASQVVVVHVERENAGNAGGRRGDGDSDCRGVRGEALGLTGDGVEAKSDFRGWSRLDAGPAAAAAIGDGDAKSATLRRLRAAAGVQGLGDSPLRGGAAGRSREGKGDTDGRRAIGEKGDGEQGDEAMRCSDGESKAKGSKAEAAGLPFALGVRMGVIGEQSDTGDGVSVVAAESDGVSVGAVGWSAFSFRLSLLLLLQLSFRRERLASLS